MIRVKIDKQGKTAVSVSDVKGASCLEKTKFLERALGTTNSHELTAEYFEQEVSSNTYCPVEFDDADEN